MKRTILTIIGIILLWSLIFTSIFLLYKLYFIQNETKLTNQHYLNTRYVNNINISTVDIHHIYQLDNEDVKKDVGLTSKYAYVTLLHGIDETYLYRGFLYNCLIVKRALVSLHSQADFIVLIG